MTDSGDEALMNAEANELGSQCIRPCPTEGAMWLWLWFVVAEVVVVVLIGTWAVMLAEDVRSGAEPVVKIKPEQG